MSKVSRTGETYHGEIDLKKLDISIEYIKSMVEGKNPINNYPLNEDSVLNNPNVIRCFYFIEDICTIYAE